MGRALRGAELRARSAAARMAEWPEGDESMIVVGGEGSPWRGVRHEQHTERQGRGYQSRSYSSWSMVTYGDVPMTVAPPLPRRTPLAWVGLLAVTALSSAWILLTARFAWRYDATIYRRTARVPLVLAWPFLAMFSPSFRERFYSAVRLRPEPSPRPMPALPSVPPEAGALPIDRRGGDVCPEASIVGPQLDVQQVEPTRS